MSAEHTKDLTQIRQNLEDKYLQKFQQQEKQIKQLQKRLDRFEQYDRIDEILDEIEKNEQKNTIGHSEKKTQDSDRASILISPSKSPSLPPLIQDKKDDEMKIDQSNISFLGESSYRETVIFLLAL
eukprot:892596_1